MRAHGHAPRRAHVSPACVRSGSTVDAGAIGRATECLRCRGWCATRSTARRVGSSFVRWTESRCRSPHCVPRAGRAACASRPKRCIRCRATEGIFLPVRPPEGASMTFTARSRLIAAIAGSRRSTRPLPPRKPSSIPPSSTRARKRSTRRRKRKASSSASTRDRPGRTGPRNSQRSRGAIPKSKSSTTTWVGGDGRRAGEGAQPSAGRHRLLLRRLAVDAAKKGLVATGSSRSISTSCRPFSASRTGKWFTIHSLTIAFVVNTKLVKIVPQSWADLLKPEYKNASSTSIRVRPEWDRSACSPRTSRPVAT